MFEKNDKKRLYWLIDQYLLKKMSARHFESEYYECYCLEVDLDALTDKEEQAFRALSEVATRFTDYEEDLRQYPGVYYTPNELHKKIVETKALLKDSWNY
jgi:hypothetical protein